MPEISDEQDQSTWVPYGKRTGTRSDRTDSPRSLRTWTLGLFTLAVIVLAIALTGSPEIEMLHDSAHYLELSRSVARGEGFTTQTHWALNIPKDTFPYPDTYRAPLYPLLVAGAYGLVGDLFTAGRCVSMLAGAGLVPLVFLFARRRLGLALPFAVLAAIFTLVHHHLMAASVRPLTEGPFALATLATLYVATANPPRAAWAGVLAGLAWLLRTQALLVVPAVALAFFHRGTRGWLRHMLVFGVVAVAVISPWLVRSTLVTGSPLSSDLRYHLTSTYEPNRSTFEYFHGLEPAPEPLDYIRTHRDLTIRHFMSGVSILALKGPKTVAGNPLLLLLAILGAAWLWTKPRRPMPTTRTVESEPSGQNVVTVLAVYAVLNVGLVAFAFNDHRHLVSLDPIVALLGAAGIAGLWDRLGRVGRRWGRLRVLLPAVALVVIAGETFLAVRGLRADRPRRLDEARAAGPVIVDELGAEESVMAEKPYFFSYLLDCRAVSLPYCSDEDFRELAEKYRVRFVCVGDAVAAAHAYPGGFLDRGDLPPWLRQVRRYQDPPMTLFEVVPEPDPAM